MVQGFGLIAFGFASLSFAVSAMGVRASIRIAQRYGMMDVPNERSSHTLPTPRMGGIAMVASATLALGGWALLAGGGPLGKGLWSTFLFALSMFVLGVVDDLRNLSPQFRFLVQLVFASMSLWSLTPLFPAVPLGGWVLHGPVWIPVGGFFAIWMLNLYNFMDGIDGLAGGEAVVASSFFFLVFAYFGEPGWAAVNLFVATASAGFLVHNWPPAKIFMGDGGSSFLGAFYGMQSVMAHLTTPVPFPVLLLPFANFILDTTFILFWRVLRGDKWYQAHRSHFYQRMADLGMTHRKVTSIELCVVAASCAAAAGCIGTSVFARIFLVAIVIAGISGIGYWVRRKELLMQSGQDRHIV